MGVITQSYKTVFANRDQLRWPWSFFLHQTWRLSVEARLERHQSIRVEGGRVRRALQKAGAVLDHVRTKDRLERRLGFLSLCAAGGQLTKAIVAYDEFASLNGLRTIPCTRFTCWGQYRLSNTRFSILASESWTVSSRSRRLGRLVRTQCSYKAP